MSNSGAVEDARSFVQQALDNAADEHRFESRKKKYPLLNELGCLPSGLDGILRDCGPSVFHGLAFRMATYEGECLFRRWEQLLSQACKFGGWDGEYSNWNSQQDHWAIKWNRFNQFLWMMQCAEYFAGEGGEVSFPYSSSDEAMPDILVRNGDGSQFYVECYHYTKWWGTEQMVKDLLSAVDKHLYIERFGNLPYDNNPFADDPEKIFAELYKHLNPDQLAELKQQAHFETPVEVCELGDFVVLLEGPGTYCPRHNAHGDPRESWPVFQKEILRKKANENGLPKHRPNLLLVNCLAIDFQLSLEQHSNDLRLPWSLDELWLCSCGVDGDIASSSKVKVQSTCC